MQHNDPIENFGLAAEIVAMNKTRQENREAGEAALKRLLPIAQRDTGQSGVVACFLLGLYNGERFPFDLTELRRLDRKIFEDCLAVLRMDWSPEKEVHRYFERGNEIFEQLAIDWDGNK